MGQRQSKRVSNTSSTISLLPTKSHQSSLPDSPASPISSISPFTGIMPPAPPRELTRLSEIIDPRTILDQEQTLHTPIRDGHPQHSTNTDSSRVGLVHSPSGNALGAEEFIAHPQRPLAMWERQERVLQATRDGMERFEAESRAGMRSRAGTRISFRRNEGAGGRKKKKKCCCCWC